MASSNLTRIKLLIGDSNPEDAPLLTDVELAQLLELYDNDVYRTAAEGCKILTARNIHEFPERAEAFRLRAADLQEQVGFSLFADDTETSTTPEPTTPTGGVSVSTVTTLITDAVTEHDNDEPHVSHPHAPQSHQHTESDVTDLDHVDSTARTAAQTAQQEIDTHEGTLHPRKSTTVPGNTPGSASAGVEENFASGDHDHGITPGTGGGGGGGVSESTVNSLIQTHTDDEDAHHSPPDISGLATVQAVNSAVSTHDMDEPHVAHPHAPQAHDHTSYEEAFDDVSLSGQVLTFSRVDDANPKEITLPESGGGSGGTASIKGPLLGTVRMTSKYTGGSFNGWANNVTVNLESVASDYNASTRTFASAHSTIGFTLSAPDNAMGIFIESGTERVFIPWSIYKTQSDQLNTILANNLIADINGVAVYYAYRFLSGVRYWGLMLRGTLNRTLSIYPALTEIEGAGGGGTSLTNSEIGDKAFSNPPSDLTNDEKTIVRNAIDLSDAEIGDKAFSNPPSDLIAEEKRSVRVAIGTGSVSELAEERFPGGLIAQYTHTISIPSNRNYTRASSSVVTLFENDADKRALLNDSTHLWIGGTRYAVTTSLPDLTTVRATFNPAPPQISASQVLSLHFDDGLAKDSELDEKSDIDHNHDSRYYTETESDARYNTKEENINRLSSILDGLAQFKSDAGYRPTVGAITTSDEENMFIFSGSTLRFYYDDARTGSNDRPSIVSELNELTVAPEILISIGPYWASGTVQTGGIIIDVDWLFRDDNPTFVSGDGYTITLTEHRSLDARVQGYVDEQIRVVREGLERIPRVPELPDRTSSTRNLVLSRKATADPQAADTWEDAPTGGGGGGSGTSAADILNSLVDFEQAATFRSGNSQGSDRRNGIVFNSDKTQITFSYNPAFTGDTEDFTVSIIGILESINDFEESKVVGIGIDNTWGRGTVSANNMISSITWYDGAPSPANGASVVIKLTKDSIESQIADLEENKVTADQAKATVAGTYEFFTGTRIPFTKRGEASSIASTDSDNVAIHDGNSIVFYYNSARTGMAGEDIDQYIKRLPEGIQVQHALSGGTPSTHRLLTLGFHYGGLEHWAIGFYGLTNRTFSVREWLGDSLPATNTSTQQSYVYFVDQPVTQRDTLTFANQAAAGSTSGLVLVPSQTKSGEFITSTSGTNAFTLEAGTYEGYISFKARITTSSSVRDAYSFGLFSGANEVALIGQQYIRDQAHHTSRPMVVPIVDFTLTARAVLNLNAYQRFATSRLSDIVLYLRRVA